MSARPRLRGLPSASVLIPDDATEHALPLTAGSTSRAFCDSRGVMAVQEDLALALVLRLLSPKGCDAIARQGGCAAAKSGSPSRMQSFACRSKPLPRHHRPRHCLPWCCKGARQPSLAHRIVGRNYLPEGPALCPRWMSTPDDEAATRSAGPWRLGLTDKAKRLATLYLNDLADVLRDAVDERFEFYCARRIAGG